MDSEVKKPVDTLVVDTTAFIQNASLQDIADKIVTCPEVVDEITNKRQLRRLIVLPYDLVVKEVFPENVQIVTEFSKKTGDYKSLSATDIKVMALTYQLEKEKLGTEHLRTEPILQRPIVTTEKITEDANPDISGFFLPGHKKEEKNDAEEKNNSEQMEDNRNQTEITEEKASTEKISSQQQEHLKKLDETLISKFEKLDVQINDVLENDETEQILIPTNESDNDEEFDSACEEDLDREFDSDNVDIDDDDESGWITPSNVKVAKKQVNSQLMEEKHVAIACMTTDFAMQNVLKQMNLNVTALDGRIIKQLRTYILRCYTCFKTTSVMTLRFCPKCGNDTLKKVAVSVDEKGEMHIHINPKRPLTARGKRYSIPRIKGGKHPNNPILVADQPMADNKPSRLARTKVNPLDDDYIAGFSPFATRDVNSKSAQLCIRPGQEVKNWMRKNPNENRRRRK